MLNNAKALCPDALAQERQDFTKDVKHVVMQNALSRTNISDAIHVVGSEKNTLSCFDIDLKTLKATDQKNSGRCWIFAGTNVLREIVAKKINVEEFELSQNYVAFFDKLEKTNYLLEASLELADKDPQDDRTLNRLLHVGIQDGGQWDMFINVIRKYGIVPKSVFPETYASGHTRDIDTLLSNQCRKFAAFAHEKALAGKIDEARVAKDELMKTVHVVLCEAFGTPVDAFDFEYQDKSGKYHLDRALTPLSFVENYIGNDLDDYVSIINAPTPTKPFDRTFTVKYVGNVIGGNNILYLNLPIATLKELVLKQLKAKSPVWFGSDCMQFRERTRGIWDLGAFAYQDSFDLDPLFPKGEELDYCESAMDHAMVITGVAFRDDAPVKWKIENSWGEEEATKGYFTATDEWFERFVYQAVINKKYLDKDQLALLTQAPIELEPWDPMGTLAQ